MNFLILVLLIAGTYLFLKFFTVHRCPYCQSRYINRYKEKETDKNTKVYICSACGQTYYRKNLFKR